MNAGSSDRAFTLIELMASMAVLSVLVMLVAQLMSGATKTTQMGSQRLDADSQARQVFDRMADDFANMVARPDVDFLIRKNEGNDEAYFFSKAPASAPASGTQQPLALVGYRVNDDKLERFGRGLSWDQPPPDGPVFLTFQTGKTTAESGSTIDTANYLGNDANNYHVLGEGVFRLEFSFLLKPTASQPATVSISPFRGGGSGTINNADKTKGGLTNVQSIVVTLGILDERARVIASNSLTTFAGSLENAKNGSEAPGKAWQAAADSLSPGQVRVYERVFPLNTGVR